MPYASIEDGICEQCGERFTYRWRAEGRRFCSQSCYNIARIYARPQRTCEQCGRPFASSPAVVERGGGRYCSDACAVSARRIPATDRYWIKVSKNGPMPEHYPELGPCWLWIAGMDERGYGTFWFAGLKRRAHRVAWQFCNGPIPDGMDVCHHCDNPSCVNPDHLFAGTVSDNMRDAVAKDRKGMKLTLDDVRIIRARADDGMPRECLAREFGVSHSNVGKIVRRDTYVEIP